MQLMKSFGIITVCMLTILSISSCDREYRTISLSEIKIIDKFPQAISLKNRESIDLDLMGNVAMFGTDSVAIFFTENDDCVWKVGMPEKRKTLSKAIAKGMGPNELVSRPNSMHKIVNPDSLSISMWYSPKQELYTAIISETDKGEYEISLKKKILENYKMAKYVIPVNDSSLYICNYDFGNNGFVRGVSTNGIFRQIVNMGTLEGDFSNININTISHIPLISPNGSDVAELMISLPQINLYSLTDSNKRISISNKTNLENIYEIDSRSSNDRVTTYSDGKAFNRGFIALYQGGVDKEMSGGRCQSKLQIYKWNGDPMVEIELGIFINSFFIDSIGMLYGYSPFGEQEALYRWDFNDIMSQYLQ